MLRTILACFLIGLISGIAGAACGPIPSDYPVLSNDRLEVGKNSSVNNGGTTSKVNRGRTYNGNRDAINASNGAVVNASSSYPSLDPATFPGTGSTDTSAAIVASGSYREVKVAQFSTTTFTGGTYYIEKLDVGKSATVKLAAGRYFIDQLSLGDKAKVVVSSGPVQLYIGSEVSGGDGLSFNAAGAVADFQVFLYPGSNWQVGKDATFVGVIYAPGTSSKIEFDDDSSIRGALVTAGRGKLGQRTSLYFSAADQAAVGGVSTCVAAAATPSGFNAFETTTAAGSVAGVIKTKVAASAFGLDVVAIRTGGVAVETAFTGAVKLELVDASSGGSCGGLGLIQNLGSLTYVTADQGRKLLAGINVSNAWPNARIRMSYPATGIATVISCSTDNFALRPAGFGSITVSDADSSTSGTARTLYNTAVTGGNVHKAGQPFRLAATAHNLAGATTSNYAGSPSATLTACVLPATGCTLGVLTTGAWAASAGTVVAANASYSEAGAFAMKLVDANFAAVDAGDGSTAAERTIESAVFNVGRFVPDHFVLTPASTPMLKTFDDTTCATRSFTYVGQPFGYLPSALPQVSIAAKNAAGGTTRNYSGALWKLLPADVTQAYTPLPVTLDTALVQVPAVTSAGSGTGTVVANANDKLAYVRTSPVAEFNALIDLSVSVADSTETAIPTNGTIATATPAVFSGIAFDSGNLIRFGRLALSNAQGSELLGLPVPLETQYWKATGFSRNVDDHCTQLVASHVALSNWQRNLSACETSVALAGRFNAGRGTLRLSAPGQNNTGSVDLMLRLDSVGGGGTCVGGVAGAATGAGQSWLQIKGNTAAYNQNPVARGSFGLFRGSKSLIYMRELY